jgi:hypothetical protein
MPRGIYDRTKIKRRGIAPDAPRIQPAHSPIVAVADAYTAAEGNERVRWTEDEIKQLASEWCLLRAANPFASSGELFEQAQRKLLAGERQRDLPSIKAHHKLYEEICRQWKALFDQPAPPTPTPPPPAAQIVTVEVPRKLTAEEMLASVDECTLEALLAAKRIAREVNFQQTLCAIAAHSNGKPAPEVAAYKPNFESFHDAIKRPRRIAVVGLPVNEEDLIIAEVKQADLNAKLCFPDGKDAQGVTRCDYAIVCRQPTHNGSDANGDRAIGQLGRSRVALLDEPDRRAIMQKVRDFLTQL